MQAAGNYNVTAVYSGSSDSAFAGSTSNVSTLTIMPAVVTITPTAGQTKVYGRADPLFTYTSSGLIGTSSLSGALGRAAGENVGVATVLVTVPLVSVHVSTCCNAVYPPVPPVNPT